MLLSESTPLGLATRFDVVVDGIELGGWQSCTGLAVHFSLEERREGGVNTHSQWLPGQITYPKIVLSRAMTLLGSTAVMAWLSGKANDLSPGTAQITLRDARGGTVASWSLRGVYPSAWTGPSMEAGSSQVAIERLELAHEGFL